MTPHEQSDKARSVLLVDDDGDFIEMATVGLNLLGYDVTGFSESFAAQEAYLHAPDEYDVVITDVCMPGMSGLKLAQAIRQVSDSIPIILISGLTESLDEAIVELLHVEPVLTKPVTPKRLAGAIDNAVDRRP